MQIVIPSRSRPYVQKTLENLSQNFWPDVIIVVPENQYSIYRAAIRQKVEIVPFGTSGIGLKRQFILKMGLTGKVIMFDDDLVFYKRNNDSKKFVRMTPDDSEEMILSIFAYLDKYAMVGLVDKFMSHARPRGHIECTRCNQVIGINRDLLPVPWPEFRLPHDEEHDFHLQLITRGCKTAIITEYSKTDRFDAPGGCSDWRDQKVLDETYRLLLEYWPSIVSVHTGRASYRWKEAMRIGGLL